ncbi:hypothetical protein [Catenulispora rubra]|uniref:hypothetical protein n=1 Tax=Catenulispora rubra TaxID=280293 RepID=UPI00189227C3|nr:hypothetical protein [Catenulispora rubra]
MSQQEQDFDTRPLADGLRELAGQAADAPGLFEAVSAGARRRSARVRASGAVLAVGGVLAVAGGVAAWPSPSGGTGAVTTDSAHAIAQAHCPAQPPGDIRPSGSAGRLFTGTPGAATLCVYGLTETSTTMRSESITGSALTSLTRGLAHGKDPDSAICTMELINPEHLLILQYADGSTQELVIDMSGCGTVGNKAHRVLLPNDLRKLITAG